MSDTNVTWEPAALRELVAALESGLEAFSLYPQASAEYRRAYARLGRAFASVWEHRPALTLTVGKDGLACDDVTVEVTEEDNACLAETLRDEGIRSLTFTAGAEGSETVRFLSAVQMARSLPPDDVDDLRTFLWDLDLEYIQYSVDEVDLAEAAATLEAEPLPAREESEAVRAQVVEEAASAERREGVVDIESFDSTLYFLDKREIEYLRDGIELEYAQDLAMNVSALLLDVMELQTDATVRTEVTGVMERLLPHLLGQGKFAAAAYLLSEANEVATRPDMQPEQRKALSQIAASLSGSDALGQLFHYLEDSRNPPTGADLSAVLVQLGPEALSAIFGWIGDLTNAQAGAALNHAVERMAREVPQALSVALKSGDRGVTVRGLTLVQRLRLKERTTDVCALAEHERGSVRAAVVETLAVLGGPAAARQLTKMIDDPEGDVRVAVLKALETRGNTKAVARLEEIIGDKSIQEKDLAEQRALFETYGSIAGSQGVELLKPILLPGWGGRQPSDVRACAALALGAIGTPGARLVLQKAERDKDPVVRNAASSALRRG